MHEIQPYEVVELRNEIAKIRTIIDGLEERIIWAVVMRAVENGSDTDDITAMSGYKRHFISSITLSPGDDFFVIDHELIMRGREGVDSGSMNQGRRMVLQRPSKANLFSGVRIGIWLLDPVKRINPNSPGTTKSNRLVRNPEEKSLRPNIHWKSVIEDEPPGSGDHLVVVDERDDDEVPAGVVEDW